jgi:hypothetical protein
VEPNVLRRCYESADFEPLRERYAADARFDALVPGRRVQLTGPDAIVAQLAAWWPRPGQLLRWHVDEYATGLTVELEREVDEGRAWRQRQFLSLEGGKIARHQVYSARPHSAVEAPPPSPLAERLLADIGDVVAAEPLVHVGQAGGWIERVRLADGRTLIVKRVVPDRDVFSRLAGLGESTEALLWQSGALERLPAWIDSAIVAAGREDGETVLVMRDVSKALVGVAGPLTREESRRFLGALAAIHQTFAGTRYDFLCPLTTYVQLLAPATLERVVGDIDYMPKVMYVGWEVFAEAAPSDVAALVAENHTGPDALVAALESCGTTVIHGDYRAGNLGLDGDRVIVLDWGIAARAPGVLDLAWYLFVNGWRIAATKEELIADYRRAAADLYDDRAIELGLLAGIGWFGGLLAHELIESDAAKRDRARRELDWWCVRAREAAERWL